MSPALESRRQRHILAALESRYARELARRRDTGVMATTSGTSGRLTAPAVPSAHDHDGRPSCHGL